MRRPARYSPSPRRPVAEDEPMSSPLPPAGGEGDAASPGPSARPAAWQPGRRTVAALTVAVLALGATSAWLWQRPTAGLQLTQKDIDAAVLKTLQTHTLPSQATRAADTIRPSVVRVVSYGEEKETPAARTEKRGRNMARGKPPEASGPPGEVERGIGTGVVIVDKGVILTNLHVVAGAQKIKVTFFDGLESVATVTGVQPENDLAVLQAQKIPDDLVAATMKSTADLRPGDQVAAVGFPFGIGPSVSAGVVSGLKRSFQSPEGRQELSNLIQFDAAANPGNSGGPLINMDGEVLGIVTAILNPTQQRTFIGIGFAVPIENAASAVGSPPF